jgi:hypothetical protein
MLEPIKHFPKQEFYLNQNTTSSFPLLPPKPWLHCQLEVHAFLYRVSLSSLIPTRSYRYRQ